LSDLIWVDIDSSVNLSLQADKRAHHNALERKRRDHIKDSFSSLRDSVPVLQGEKQSVKQASRAQILDKATDYIQYMRRKNHTHQQDIDDLKKQNLGTPVFGEFLILLYRSSQALSGWIWNIAA
uniref:Protein max n=1 Tax=Hucho hucho TaxID=62062 RepID=A0A4W5N895_9TELE